MTWRYISKPVPLGCGESLQVTAELHDNGVYHTRVLHGDRTPVDRYDDLRSFCDSILNLWKPYRCAKFARCIMEG